MEVKKRDAKIRYLKRTRTFYKVLFRWYDVYGNPHYLTPFFDMPIDDPGKVQKYYEIEKGEPLAIVKNQDSADSLSSTKAPYEVHGSGFHLFTRRREARKYLPRWEREGSLIVKAIVPKGTAYVKGRSLGGYRNVVVRKVMYQLLDDPTPKDFKGCCAYVSRS